MVQFAGSIPDPLAQLEEIMGNPVTDFPNDPNTYAPANRPQDIRYEFPERGAENHGVTDDDASVTYFPDQVHGDARVVTDDTGALIVAEELIPPDPVAVYEVPNPLRSIRKFTSFQTIFDPYPTWSAAALSGPDLSTVVMMGADENRTRIQFVTGRSLTAFANQVVGAWFAVSSDPSFSQYATIVFSTAMAAPVTVFTLENCKEALYFALLPIVAYDSTKTQAATLTAIVEYAQPIDHNPVQAV